LSATKINRIHKELHRIRTTFQADSLKLIVELMTLCQITVADLDEHIRKSQTGRKTAPKASPIAVTSKRPASATKSTANMNPAKKDNYRRGPQPAKYLNPKTGETWSGLARPPAWIADVKNRAKFLIGK
jgi:DNA-binding protein H-NS